MGRMVKDLLFGAVLDDVSAHLANLITKKLHYKARAEKPGLLGRASIAWQSVTEAYKDWVRPLLGRPLPKLMDLRSEI